MKDTEEKILAQESITNVESANCQSKAAHYQGVPPRIAPLNRPTLVSTGRKKEQKLQDGETYGTGHTHRNDGKPNLIVLL